MGPLPMTLRGSCMGRPFEGATVHVNTDPGATIKSGDLVLVLKVQHDQGGAVVQIVKQLETDDAGNWYLVCQEATMPIGPHFVPAAIYPITEVDFSGCGTEPARQQVDEHWFRLYDELSRPARMEWCRQGRKRGVVFPGLEAVLGEPVPKYLRLPDRYALGGSRVAHAGVVTGSNTSPPSEAALTVTANIGGTITFEIADPDVRPRETRFQLIRGLVSTNAAIGTVFYDGLSQRVDLMSPTSNHFYWSRAYANSYYGPYSPNTTGLTAAASGMNAGQMVPNAFTYVTMTNCTATQTFSKGGIALYAGEMGRLNFTPQDDDADVVITATLRAGLGNFNTTNRIGVQFVTGVTSSYSSTVFLPNGGTTADLRPTTIQQQFQYTRNNSAYAVLFWDAASGPNSVVIDNVSIRGEFIKR